MLAAALLAGLVGYADTTDIAHRVQIHLSASAQPWLIRNRRKLKRLSPTEEVQIVYEVELNRRGGFTGARLSLSSGHKKLDRFARSFFSVVPPVRDLPPVVARARRNTPCVVAFSVGGGRRAVNVAAVCLPKDDLPQVARRSDMQLDAASDLLFSGWAHEASGSVAKARAAFRQASEEAPHWGLTYLSLGLNMARGGQVDEARPLLLRGLGPRKPGPEIRRYLKGLEPAERRDRSGGNVDETTISACERDEGEMFHHIRKRFRKLSRCVAQEKKRAPTSKMPSALPIGLVVVPAGGVKGVEVRHRFYPSNSPFNACVAKALKGRLKKRGGSNCSIQFEIETQ